MLTFEITLYIKVKHLDPVSDPTPLYAEIFELNDHHRGLKYKDKTF